MGAQVQRNPHSSKAFQLKFIIIRRVNQGHQLSRAHAQQCVRAVVHAPDGLRACTTQQHARR